MTATSVKHTLYLALLCAVVFFAVIAICNAIQSGTLAGDSMSRDIDSHFGQIVRDRQAAAAQSTQTTTP